jgi:ketosteroid isomerase-like protein
METRQAIEKLNAEFVDAYNRGDIAEIATGYAEDSAVLAPNQPTVHGKQAIETLFKGMIEEIGGTASIFRRFGLSVGHIFPRRQRTIRCWQVR